jgi:hypothetical protein
MKKLFLMATMLLMFGMVNAQISDVQQSGQYIKVFGESGNKISEMQMTSDMELLGFGNSFFVVNHGSYIETYNQNSKKITEKQFSSDCYFKSASGNSINFKHGTYIETYDKNLQKISERYAN